MDSEEAIFRRIHLERNLTTYRENQDESEPSESPPCIHSLEDDGEIAPVSEMVISTNLGNLNISNLILNFQ